MPIECACGCGQLAPLIQRNNARLGHRRGQSCVNPAHLEPVTPAENRARQTAARRQRIAVPS